ncbi:hypothetical protein WJX72_010509 [[Myrmecia] bisecta]|uniref:Uncharacterized protein n=1 Tax=[Myrmecia] bisecta TaxID=41462 RepID=A0AAW1R9J3_9CHLO
MQPSDVPHGPPLMVLLRAGMFSAPEEQDCTIYIGSASRPFEPAWKLQSGATPDQGPWLLPCSDEWDTVQLDKASYVYGRRLSATAPDGSQLALIEQQADPELRAVQLPLNRMLGHCYRQGARDMFHVSRAGRVLSWATRLYPGLECTVMSIGGPPIGAISRQRFVEVFLSASSQPGQPALGVPLPQGLQSEVDAMYVVEYWGTVPGQVKRDEVVQLILLAAIMEEARFAPHVRLPPFPPPTLPAPPSGGAVFRPVLQPPRLRHLEGSTPDDAARRGLADQAALHFQLSVDLGAEALHLLSFLHEVDRFPALYAAGGAGRALRRYQQCWLPLLGRQAGDAAGLTAPLDVAWVWFAHMLCPSSYMKDFRAATGREATSVACVPYRRPAAALQQAKALWEAAYHNEPFVVADLSPRQAEAASASAGSSSLTYDVIEAVGRQKAFLYQVSLPHYRDRAFLDQSVRRYKQFLYLRKHNPGAFLVPTFDIDLVWHCHQANHAAYVRDTVSVTGSLFTHDDSVNDRTPGRQLDGGYKLTSQLWEATFGQPYAVDGGMWRGHAPPGPDSMNSPAATMTARPADSERGDYKAASQLRGL